MAKRKKKPYEQKTRPVSVTLPNVLLDRIEKDMRAHGEDNLSAKIAEIVEWWCDAVLNERPLAEALPKEIDETEDLYAQLNRYSGFSSSPFVGSGRASKDL